jgi:hypothetical protein
MQSLLLTLFAFTFVTPQEAESTPTDDDVEPVQRIPLIGPMMPVDAEDLLLSLENFNWAVYAASDDEVSPVPAVCGFTLDCGKREEEEEEEERYHNTRKEEEDEIPAYCDPTQGGPPLVVHTQGRIERVLPLETPLVLIGSVSYTSDVFPELYPGALWDIYSSPYEPGLGETNPLQFENPTAFTTTVTSNDPAAELKPGEYVFALHVGHDCGVSSSRVTVVLLPPPPPPHIDEIRQRSEWQMAESVVSVSPPGENILSSRLYERILSTGDGRGDTFTIESPRSSSSNNEGPDPRIPCVCDASKDCEQQQQQRPPPHAEYTDDQQIYLPLQHYRGVKPFSVHTQPVEDRVLPLTEPLVLSGSVSYTSNVQAASLHALWRIIQTPYTGESHPLEIERATSFITIATNKDSTVELRPGKYIFALYVGDDSCANYALLTITLLPPPESLPL